MEADPSLVAARRAAHDVCGEHDVDPEAGLAQREAEARLLQHGSNELTVEDDVGRFLFLPRRFAVPLPCVSCWDNN